LPFPQFTSFKDDGAPIIGIAVAGEQSLHFLRRDLNLAQISFSGHPANVSESLQRSQLD